ncbi:MAG: extracellular solute-binding protein [Candidatus Hydrogenedentota bacterium]|nr:MAG: extracellular solute-binding protein [Candidatus Hydrogenedentota bacterium]
MTSLSHPFQRFIITLFTLVFLGALLGCGPAQKPVTIKLWEFPRWRERPDSIDRFFWIRRQIGAFERMHPDVSIELTELTWERGEDKKRIAIVAGAGPDIITGTLPVEFIERGLVEPVDAYMTPEEKADFFAPALDAFTYKGKVYGWPWYLTGSAMFLNFELFERYGVRPPDADWNSEEFLDSARRLTRDLDGDGKPEAYGFGFLVHPGDTTVWPFLFPGGIRLPPEDPTALSDLKKEGEAGLGFLHELIHEERVAPAQCAAWDTEALWQRFTNQRDIAMAPWGIWAIPKLRTTPDFSFAVLPYPSLNDCQPARPTRAFIGTAGYIVLHQPESRKRELCMEFARFLVRPEAQRDLAPYGVFPSRISTGNIYEGDELMAKTQEIITSGQTVPQHLQWAKIDEKLQREMQMALLGEKSVNAALSDGAVQTLKILEESAEQAIAASTAGRPNRMLFVISAIFASGALFILCIAALTRRGLAASASAFAFICPALTVFGVFLLFPLCWVMMLSFQHYSIADAYSKWVGLQNLRSAIHDPVFIRAALNTLIYAAVVVPANTLSALVVASLIYPLSSRTRSFFRGAYYLPGVASIVIIAMVWRWMFNENLGLLNAVLGFLGLPGVRWLTSPHVALWSVILTSIARPPGGPILIYLAALDAIPTPLYDAGEIDGAGPLKRWWHITIPLLRPTTLFLALTITIASFQVFAQILILTDGGPGYSTEVVVHRIYTSAIRDFDFGVASAMSLILFGVIMFVSALQYRFFRSEIEF